MPTEKTIIANTPSPQTVITTRVHRSWKTRILIIVNGATAFILALLGYLQTVNLQNFGLTADRALFWMAIIGLAQFLLAQWRPINSIDTHVSPGGGEQEIK